MNNLKLHGDLVERYFFEFIEKHFPTYIKIWDHFISQPDDHVKDEKKRKKQRLSQLIYTCLDGVVSVKAIKDKHCKGVYLPSISEDSFIPTYYELMNDIFLFNAHIGRVSELVRKEIPSILKGMDKSLLQKYFDNRNNVIHSQRIPFSREEDGFLAIPRFEGQDKVESWRHYGEMTWNDANPNRFQFLSDYIVSTFDTFLIDLEEVFQIILSKIKTIFVEFSNITTALPSTQESSILFLSGSTEDPSVRFSKQDQSSMSGPIQSTFQIDKKRKK